jgi:uncharacterized protein (DUF1330 family)
MAAYLIVNIAAIHDDRKYAEYRHRVTETIRAVGGEYLVRGGHVDVLEGSWQPNRVVVVRFPSAQAAQSWWSSPAYTELKQMRQDSAVTEMILVEGIE